MSLFLRHGPKQYSNGKSNEYCLDPALTLEGKELAALQFREYVGVYGMPTQIRTSPYLRARETAAVAQEIMRDIGAKVPIVVDRGLSEYLGNQSERYLPESFRPETWNSNPIKPENYGEFRGRVRRWYKKVKPDVTVWYITHGTVIREVALIGQLKTPRPAELHGIRMEGGVATVI